MSLSGFAGGAAAALQQAEQDREAKLYQQHQMRLNQEALLRALAGDEESRRRWDADYKLRESSQKSLDEGRRAEAERDRAAAEKDANRQKGLQSLVSDPTALQALPALQRLLTLNQYGVNNIGLHDVESPDEHSAHTKVEKDAAFADWQKRADYSEQQRRSRPRITGQLRLAPGADDPALPRGVQDYIVKLRSKYGTFDEAQGEFSRALEDLRAAHPNLSSARALNTLRQSFTGSTRQGTGSAAVNQVIAAARGGGGRGVNPSQPLVGGPSVPAVKGNDRQLQDVTRAALRERLGRDATDAEVQTILSNPKNRALLERAAAGGQ